MTNYDLKVFLIAQISLRLIHSRNTFYLHFSSIGASRARDKSTVAYLI